MGRSGEKSTAAEEGPTFLCLCHMAGGPTARLSPARPPQSVGPAPPHLTRIFPSSACALSFTWVAALNAAY